MSESARIEGPVETPARGVSQNAMTHPGYFTRHAGKCAAADLEGFAHSAAADGEKSSSAGQAEQPKEAAIWTYVFACPSPGGDLALRLCMFERLRWLAGDMDLRFCMVQGSWSYGLTFVYV